MPMPTNAKDTTTRDPLDAHNATATKLYESDRKPLPPTPGQMYTWSPAGAAFAVCRRAGPALWTRRIAAT
jgi:hypothetical protein